MKKAIEYLRSTGLIVTDNGTIVSTLPDGEDGLDLVDNVEEISCEEDTYYTIIKNKLEKIEI